MTLTMDVWGHFNNGERGQRKESTMPFNNINHGHIGRAAGAYF